MSYFIHSNREEINKLGGKVNLSMGVVQTAYANGASSQYLHDTMKIEIACVPTGVKHLHHKAADFDIGVYFEANGHGTVLFKEGAVHRLTELKKSWEKDGFQFSSFRLIFFRSASSSEKEALDRILNLPNLINQAIGDALSDILLVEAVLRQKGWSLKEWVLLRVANFLLFRMHSTLTFLID